MVDVEPSGVAARLRVARRVPGSGASRGSRQLENERPLAEKLIAWEWSSCLSPNNGSETWPEATKENYEAYKKRTWQALAAVPVARAERKYQSIASRATSPRPARLSRLFSFLLSVYSASSAASAERLGGPLLRDLVERGVERRHQLPHVRLQGGGGGGEVEVAVDREEVVVVAGRQWQRVTPAAPPCRRRPPPSGRGARALRSAPWSARTAPAPARPSSASAAG